MSICISELFDLGKMVRFMSELVIKCVFYILMVLWHLNPPGETRDLESIII